MREYGKTPGVLSRLYEHHAPIQYVSEQLGHTSIKITVDAYGHPRQGTSIALADQLAGPASDTRRHATSAQPVMPSTVAYAVISKG